MLLLEAKAIERCAGLLSGKKIDKAIELILTSKGKVVVIGVGKSGIIANKIAATFTSTGTTAIYMHASDAMHGDLGIIGSKDVLIMLSNSGETSEILALLPHIKQRNVPIIAIVGNVRSTLANHADVAFDASITREACPLNLAPTCSTTVALAIGDALAMTLMEVKGITSENFAINHPAGGLGKRLSLKVKDLMRTDTRNFVVAPETSWNDILSKINEGKIGAVNIVDGNSALLGIITDGDIRRIVQNKTTVEIASLTAISVMTKNPVVVKPEMLAYDALQLMEKRPSQISVLPVINENNYCMGLIRLHDIVGKI
ncbi:KpsF/GutQ family sugar-phosphate isomerase [Adhaeribacter arboris]|uniref:KpsF/GutQ family sugar-phosphate isomerase n=2 Tax=Adhaeribacter arboris TaxID=2072846 RepID=A0A2T2YNN2_9BACT|nr:KpsF/GutQ family sugar-phosphate isomerase [Adhaeribacter arboris]